MQGSKIKIDTIYAVRDDEQKLRMFRVIAVNTRRTGPHPADFTHRVEGWLLNDDRSVINREKVVTVTPDEILGEYEAHAELVARKAAADAESKRIAEAKEELQFE